MSHGRVISAADFEGGASDMVRSLVVAGYAACLGVRFWRDFAIRRSEIWRYFSKLFALGMLYAGFVKPPSVKGFKGAGRAAFLSCAYDVVTDWRSFAPEFRKPFQAQLQCLVPAWAVKLTMTLYWEDLKGGLKEDGLERGGIAVEFITGVAGSSAYFSEFGLRRLGTFLQIVDDVLDLEKDVVNDEQNCLRTPRAERYLRCLVDDYEAVLILFASDRLMRLAIQRAYRKAHGLIGELQR